MDVYQAFASLPLAASSVDFSAVPLMGGRSDFLAKASDGGPVLLLHDASPATYSPAIELKFVSVQFNSTCRVNTDCDAIESQFAIVSCDGSVPELHEVFIRCLTTAAARLPPAAGTTELQICIRSLLDLFRALSRPANQDVIGLWAELFVIARSKNVVQALRAWHADPFERFDFSWLVGCLEVKATTQELRQHDFALEQLQSPVGGSGYVVSLLMQPLSGGIGVLDLANEIEASVSAHLDLREKLWGNIAAALGSDFAERLDRRFDPSYAERSLAVYAMGDIPAPHEPTDPRISAVRFRVDLSSTTTSLSGSARSALDALLL